MRSPVVSLGKTTQILMDVLSQDSSHSHVTHNETNASKHSLFYHLFKSSHLHTLVTRQAAISPPFKLYPTNACLLP